MIQKIDDMGKLDDTLIIFITGDNGCSAEGTVNGTPNEALAFNGAACRQKSRCPFTTCGEPTRPIRSSL